MGGLEGWYLKIKELREIIKDVSDNSNIYLEEEIDAIRSRLLIIENAYIDDEGDLRFK